MLSFESRGNFEMILAGFNFVITYKLKYIHLLYVKRCSYNWIEIIPKINLTCRLITGQGVDRLIFFYKRHQYLQQLRVSDFFSFHCYKVIDYRFFNPANTFRSTHLASANLLLLPMLDCRTKWITASIGTFETQACSS